MTWQQGLVANAFRNCLQDGFLGAPMNRLADRGVSVGVTPRWLVAPLPQFVSQDVFFTQ